MAIVKVSLGSVEALVYFRVFFPEHLLLELSDVALGEIVPVQNSTESGEGYGHSTCGNIYQKVNNSKSFVLTVLISIMYRRT